MGITNAIKELNVSTIPCGGTFNATLALTAAPDIVSNPTDIVLIPDRSGSMTQSLPSLKEAAIIIISLILLFCCLQFTSYFVIQLKKGLILITD